MKKVTFIFIGVIYVLAIILVAFLGVQSHIQNQTVEVTDIVLTQAKDMGKGEILTYPEGSQLKASVYALYTRPEEDQIDENGKYNGVIWNVGSEGDRYDYVVQIRDFNVVADSASWRDGPMHFDLGAMVLPENATKKDLAYSIQDSNGNTPSNATISPNLGLIHFTEKFAKKTHFRVFIRSTDNSGIQRLIDVIVGAYKAE